MKKSTILTQKFHFFCKMLFVSEFGVLERYLLCSIKDVAK